MGEEALGAQQHGPIRQRLDGAAGREGRAEAGDGAQGAPRTAELRQPLRVHLPSLPSHGVDRRQRYAHHLGEQGRHD